MRVSDAFTGSWHEKRYRINLEPMRFGDAIIFASVMKESDYAHWDGSDPRASKWDFHIFQDGKLPAHATKLTSVAAYDGARFCIVQGRMYSLTTATKYRYDPRRWLRLIGAPDDDSYQVWQVHLSEKTPTFESGIEVHFTGKSTILRIPTKHGEVHFHRTLEVKRISSTQFVVASDYHGPDLMFTLPK